MPPSYQDVVVIMVLESELDDDVDDVNDEVLEDYDELHAAQDLVEFLEHQFVLAEGDEHALWIHEVANSLQSEKLFDILCT